MLLSISPISLFGYFVGFKTGSRLCEVNIQHRIIGMPGKHSRRKIPVVVVHQHAGTSHNTPNIILQLSKTLPTVLGVVPGVAHNILIDIQQAVPVAPLGELLHPLAPGGVDVLLLVVTGAEHHHAVALKAVVVYGELLVVDTPGMSGLGVADPDEQPIIGASFIIAISTYQTGQRFEIC